MVGGPASAYILRHVVTTRRSGYLALSQGVSVMGSFGPIHWIIVAVVVLLLFGGRGKLSGIMGDAAKGIRAFKDGLKDDVSTEVADNKAKGSLPRTEQEAEELRKS
jgi:sec-independent protein translocase protein TatA